MFNFGLDFFPVCDPGKTSGEQYFQESLKLAAEGERLGFTSVKTIEHHATDYGGYSPNPLLFLCAAAQRTTAMKLITGCVVPAFWHPVKLAGELAMADALCQGRLEVGFARGFLPHEFELFERGLGTERALRFREAIDLIKKFWSNESVHFAGDYYQIEGTTVYPPMARMPNIWIAATHTANSFKWAGAEGYGLLLVPYVSDFEDLRAKIDIYRRAYTEAGHGEPNKITFTMHACVHADRDKAIALAREPLERYLRAFVGTGAFKPEEYQAFQDTVIREIKALTYERIIEEKRSLIGTPEEVVETLHYYREFFGALDFSLGFNFGDMPYGQALESMNVFSEHVIQPYAVV
ncbi:LLM class flavin-dependent oxidoreductase [Paenibacillus oenotherae]|uniref:LLM class flavin-dependent oxidoreductase n=1 Tax=Paenibacillus oenotherae TaxID=1435645 RepID=A0ABS7D9D6_9BACL|nr:LLM class flavin-dependent oxidoreductase [Paenibacillus oenotherae]MBW7476491.1 LLM class flavin-dependent oxidoreductase [Paenibacillus oenotherae]